MQGGRTMVLQHRGMTVTVKESINGTCVLQFDRYQQPTEAKFKGACREAMTYLFDNAGQMQGDYER